MTKLPVSAIVASRNEADLLEDCLKSLSFCSEIIVYDLESTDRTKEVAEAHGAKVIPHKLVPIVEEIRRESVAIARFDWMFFLDPDETLTSPLQKFIVTNFDQAVKDKYTAFDFPWVFFYKSHRLRGGVWGEWKFKRCLLDRRSYNFTAEIHFDIMPRGNEKVMTVPNREDAYIHHQWMRSSKELFEKHRRYISKEAKQLKASGTLYFLKRHLKVVAWSFYDYLVVKKGFKDAWTGLYLAWFWAWYKHNIWKEYSVLSAQ
ncbi:MAG TPA: glycosyltransferase [Cyclobacteriaceae bacterium]|nr:glycosyltransferase [Cyclobacteriaceae bacterium]